MTEERQPQPSPTPEAEGATQPVPSGPQESAAEAPQAQPTPEVETAPTSAGEAPTPEAEAPKAPSRVGRFFRRLAWTLLALFVVFAAGFLTAWYTQVTPRQNQIAQLTEDQQSLEQAKADLEVQVADLQQQLQDAQSRIQDLESQLQDAQAEANTLRTRMYILSALADTYAGKLTLAHGETTSARLYLSNAKAAITLLEDLLPEQKDSLSEMRYRIDEALGKLDTNPLSAQGDLDVLANALVQLEKLVTGQ